MVDDPADQRHPERMPLAVARIGDDLKHFNLGVDVLDKRAFPELLEM